MSDEENDDGCESEEYVMAGPMLNDGSRACIKHCHDHSLKFGNMYPLIDGKPIPDNAEIVERIGDGPYFRPLRNSNSTSKITTKKYRDGWDRIFDKSKLN